MKKFIGRRVLPFLLSAALAVGTNGVPAYAVGGGTEAVIPGDYKGKTEQPPDSTMILTWEWPGDIVIEENEETRAWELTIPGERNEKQVDFETVVSMLPTEVSVWTNEAQEKLPITLWTCEDFPDGGVYEGAYTFSAKLPEEYVLAEGLSFPEVTVLVENEIPAVYASEGLASLEITKQPESVSSSYGYSGSNAPQLSITANPTGSVTEITYQWYKVGTGAAGTDEAISGADKSSYTAEVGMDVGIYSYYCIVTCDGYSLKSDTATITLTKKEVSASGQDTNCNVIMGNGAFSEPSFDGVNGEKITGTLVYSYNGKTSYRDVVLALSKLANKATADVGYTFTADGNYTGTITGTVKITVVQVIFSGVWDCVSTTFSPTYGNSWGEILIYKPEKLNATLDGKELKGSFELLVNNKSYHASDLPTAGRYNWKVQFSEEGGIDYQKIRVSEGFVIVEKRKAALSWSDTTLTYNSKAQKPVAQVDNKIGDDDVNVTVAGEQINVGSYTATGAALTGADASNYTLDKANPTDFTIVPALASGEILLTMEDHNDNGMLDCGDTVTADTSSITPSGGTMSYQWQKSSNGTTSIVGTDSASYTLTSSDTSGELFCTVTFSGNTTGTITSAAVVIAKKFLTGNISITGNPVKGETLTVSTPDNVGLTSADYDITWLQDGIEIEGAKEPTYNLTKYDLGKTLKAVITAKESSQYFTGSLASAEFIIPATVPEKPFISVEKEDGTATISWETPFDNGSALTGYKLTVKENGKDMIGSPFDLSKETKSYKADGLTNSSDYEFMLTALNGMGSIDSNVVKVKRPSSSTGGGSVIAPAAQEKPDAPTRYVVTVKPDISGGTANVTLSADTVKQAIDAAKKEAAKNGAVANGIAVEIKVDTGKSGAQNLAVTLSKHSIGELVEAGVKEVRITSGAVSVHIDLATLKEMQKQLGADVTITATKVDNNTLSKKAKKLVGNRPVYEFTITGASGKTLADFGGGNISISIPYTLGNAEKAGNVVAYYMDSKGNLREMPHSSYNAGTRRLMLTTGHFSRFCGWVQGV